METVKKRKNCVTIKFFSFHFFIIYQDMYIIFVNVYLISDLIEPTNFHWLFVTFFLRIWPELRSDKRKNYVKWIIIDLFQCDIFLPRFSRHSICNKGRVRWDLLRKKLAFAMSRQSSRFLVYLVFRTWNK